MNRDYDYDYDYDYYNEYSHNEYSHNEYSYNDYYGRDRNSDNDDSDYYYDSDDHNNDHPHIDDINDSSFDLQFTDVLVDNSIKELKKIKCEDLFSNNNYPNFLEMTNITDKDTKEYILKNVYESYYDDQLYKGINTNISVGWYETDYLWLMYELKNMGHEKFVYDFDFNKYVDNFNLNNELNYNKKMTVLMDICDYYIVKK
jgi:hypothetical protein